MWSQINLNDDALASFIFEITVIYSVYCWIAVRVWFCLIFIRNCSACILHPTSRSQFLWPIKMTDRQTDTQTQWRMDRQTWRLQGVAKILWRLGLKQSSRAAEDGGNPTLLSGAFIWHQEGSKWRWDQRKKKIECVSLHKFVEELQGLCVFLQVCCNGWGGRTWTLLRKLLLGKTICKS